MSSKKKNLLKTILTANAGCGCGRPKLSDVYEPTPTPMPKPKTFISQKDPCSTSSSCDKSTCFSMDNEEDCATSTTITFNIDNYTTSTQNSESEADNPKPSKIIDSIAVVKDSNDPFQDFKHSMLQMILEKEIYSKDDLQDLLNCFLELNSPCQYDVIVQAFTEIWNNEVISSKRLIKSSQKPCDEGVSSHES